MKQKEAEEILEKYLRDHGCKEANVLGIQPIETGGFEFQLLEPYGVFFVLPDGEIIDNYKVFEGEENDPTN